MARGLRSLVVVVVVGLALGLGACSSIEGARVPATESMAAAGDEAAARMVAALGGMDAFARAPGISFDFVAEAFGVEIGRRHHIWDKANGRAYARDGDEEAWFSLDDKTGVARIDGQWVTGGEATRHTEAGYAKWVNDTFWLVAPYKVFDEGARRALVDGKLRLSFADVGLTPGDVYFFVLDDETGAPTGWQYALQSGAEGEATFRSPVVREGVTFHEAKTGLLDIRFEHIEVLDEPGRFFSPLEDGPPGGLR